MQKHAIFRQFSDYCMERAGVDKSWACGTEHRQLNIYEPELRSAKAMKNMMVDHIKRRYFIIDADINVSVYFVTFGWSWRSIILSSFVQVCLTFILALWYF